MLPNIVLIGFMGSGKSSVGRRLSNLTGHRFVDTDELIVEKSGTSIADLFATQGEDIFRRMEREVLAELVGVCGIILATGGGIVTQPQNQGLLHEIGVVAWIDADPDVIFQRVSRTRKRPLLQTPDPRASFDTLLTSRRSIYETAADFRVDSTGLTHDEAARRILDESLRFHARRV